MADNEKKQKKQKQPAAAQKRVPKPKRIRKGTPPKWPQNFMIEGYLSAAAGRDAYTFLKAQAIALGLAFSKHGHNAGTPGASKVLGMAEAVNAVNKWRQQLSLPSIDPIGDAARAAQARRAKLAAEAAAEAARLAVIRQRAAKQQRDAARAAKLEAAVAALAA